MKFTTFKNIVTLVLFASIGGSCYGCYFYWNRAITHQELERQQAMIVEREQQAERAKALEAQRLVDAAAASRQAAETAATDIARTKTPGAFWSKAADLREVDKAALALLDRPVVDKIKDGARGKPFKINVYSDDKVRFNRVKLDLDRDDKDDETWTVFADGRIERKVSSADNGTWDGTYRLELSGWQDSSAKPVTPLATTTTTKKTTTTKAEGGIPQTNAVDAAMVIVMRLPVHEKIKDATKGQAFKINLYADGGQRFNRAKVDLDRDDKWDESWTFKSATDIERQVAPADDEHYTEVYVATDGAWAKKP